MKTISKPGALGAILSLLFLCSCATENPAYSGLPAKVRMNQEAGRGGLLIVTLRLKNGEKLPFVMDTGASQTCFDKSLEPKLGKRLGTSTMWHFGVKHQLGLYAAPRLYWGRTRLLMTGTNVVSYDCRPLSTNAGCRIMGILGMDVLAHYCIQLDFAADRIRFLNDQYADKKTWGHPFPLTGIGDGCFVIGKNLVGAKGPGSLIDTGCDYDGWLLPALFQQWTNHADPPVVGQVRSPDAVLGGKTYTKVGLDELDPKSFASDDPHVKFNGIGLQFLSRHLVTLDFPERTLYLKRISAGPFIDKAMKSAAKSDGKSALKFLKRLKKKGRLPGWSRNDEVATKTVHFFFRYPEVVTFDHLVKKGDPSVYHYQLARPSKHSPWKLQKAWRTDQAGRTIQKYPIP